jgi:hypothetical protein
VDTAGNLYIAVSTATSRTILKLDTSYNLTIIPMSNIQQAIYGFCVNTVSGITTLYAFCQSVIYSINIVGTQGNSTLLAGSTTATGYVDGQGSVARFSNTLGSITIINNNIYAIDTANQKIRIITLSGEVTTLRNSAGSPIQVTPDTSITFDSTNSIYTGLGYTINKIVNNGGTYSQAVLYAGTGSEGNTDGKTPSFNLITSICMNTSINTLYIADFNNKIIRFVLPPALRTNNLVGLNYYDTSYNPTTVALPIRISNFFDKIFQYSLQYPNGQSFTIPDLYGKGPNGDNNFSCQTGYTNVSYLSLGGNITSFTITLQSSGYSSPSSGLWINASAVPPAPLYTIAINNNQVLNYTDINNDNTSQKGFNAITSQVISTFTDTSIKTLTIYTYMQTNTGPRIWPIARVSTVLTVTRTGETATFSVNSRGPY